MNYDEGEKEMAYSRGRSTRRSTRGYSTRARTTRARPAGRARRAPARRSRASSRSAGELRIVIEQPGASGVSRYPGVAARMTPPPRKARY